MKNKQMQQWYDRESSITRKGEKSTKYFLNMEKRNIKNKTWNKIKCDDGTFKTDIQSILKEQKGTSRQRSGKGAIRKRFPLQKPRWEKTKLTIRYLYHETYRKPNEQLFSQ